MLFLSYLQEPEREMFEGSIGWKILKFFHLSGRNSQGASINDILGEVGLLMEKWIMLYRRFIR